VNVWRDSDLCRNLDLPRGTAALKSKLLEKSDPSVVVVNVAKRSFERLLDREKIPYLVRAVEAAVSARLNSSQETAVHS
jgi:hypothetical protein